jgi:PAS domain S-box-containing protein
MRIPIVDQVMSFVRKPNGMVLPRTVGRDEKLRAVFAKVPVGIAIATMEGPWVFVNDRFRALVGYTDAELGRITLHGITHPDDAKGEHGSLKKLKNGDMDSYRVEKRVMARNGQYRSFEVVTALANDLLIYVVDEPRPSILDHLPGVAVIRTDDRGVITDWNAGAEAIFGYRRAEILGKNRRNLYRDADSWAGRSTGILQSAALQDRMEMNDWRVRKDGSHIWVHSTVAIFETSGVKGYVEIVMAATESTEPLHLEIERRKRTEESLREGFVDLRRTSEETMNELRIMTAALRDEIDRRKAAEDELRNVSARLAAVPPPVVAAEPEVENLVIATPPARKWRPLDEQHTVAGVLRTTAAEQRSGTLLFSSNGREKEVFFEHGRLFSCASNDPSKFLAERLVAAGTITEEQRHKAIEIKQASQLALGRILLILGMIDETQLVTAMRSKLEDELAELLSWSQGRYVFVEGEVPSLQLVPLRIDVEAILAPPVVFVASARSGKVHRAACLSVKRISASARVEPKTTEGFELCRLCFR